MQRPDDMPPLPDCDDIACECASTLMEQLSGVASDYETFDHEWIAGAGL